nr:PREDICTED: DNA replication factor Cdt1 isoform X2 [Lepisosteus oculatus]
MAQARVTDYFAQNKKGGVDRVLRSKRQKNEAAGEAVVLGGPAGTGGASRTARSRRKNADCPAAAGLELVEPSAIVQARASRSKRAAPDSGGDGEVAEGEIKSDTAAGSAGVSADGLPAGPEDNPPVGPPRTPKRSSSQAEFDLSSEVFCRRTGHSSAKKRARADADGEASAAGASGAVKKSARKKLLLLKDGETQEQVSGPTLQLASPLSVDKKVKNLVNRSAGSSPVCQRDGAGSGKPLSLEDMGALRARLQKIKERDQLVGRSHPASTPAPPAAELKARLDRARELGAKTQRRKEEKSAEVENELDPVESEKVPAYQRYHTLAQDVPPGLSLPYKYKMLAEMFRCLDTIVSILFNRSETATFAKVKQGVQDMMHKRFEESHVGQIKTVYPTAYTFRQEKNIPTFSDRVKQSSYQLTIEPVIDMEEKSDARPQLSASHLLERRRGFHQRLVTIVKEHHKAFLDSLTPPLSVPDDKLTRWHPRFNVDQVPNIPACELPQPPQVDRLTTAQEVLNKARSLMTPKMEKALANMALKTAESLGAADKQESSPKPAPATPSALRGVSQSLLERIRAKEAQKLQAMMTRDPQQEERLLMMSRLGELARILRNVFVAEKKPALIMELACNRVIASHRSLMTTGEMEKHLKLLSELTPEWLAIHPVRKDLYLKLNKNMDLNVVLEQLSQKAKAEERC